MIRSWLHHANVSSERLVLSKLLLLSVSIHSELEQVHITVLLIVALQVVLAGKHVSIRRVLLGIRLCKVVAEVHEIGKLVVVAIGLDVRLRWHQMVRVVFDLLDTVETFVLCSVVERRHFNLGLRRLEVHCGELEWLGARNRLATLAILALLFDLRLLLHL